MKRELSWPAVAVVAAAVAVTSFSGYLLASWPPEPPASSIPARAAAAVSTSAAPSSEPSPSPAPRTVVAVLGDSFSAEGPATKATPWPRIVSDDLGWELADRSVDGSGFLTGKPFEKRVRKVLAADPDVIVVAGGERDLGKPVDEVTAAAADVVARLAEGAPDARIVVLSPFSRGEPGPLTTRVGSALQDIAEANHAEYVDATRWLAGDEGPYVAPDGIHPTQAGQRRIARRLERALTRIGIAGPTASP